MLPLRQRRINLALQGGGALGALTWGVLDRLLEEPRLSFDGVTGASAGAMNAVALAHGWRIGGREGARKTLDAFWTGVGAYPLELGPSEGPPKNLTHVQTRFLLGLTRFFSPYQLNPLDVNPLRNAVAALFNFEGLRRASPLRVFIGATQVRTGALRVFRDHELTPDHLLASACLPTLSQAVVIDGEAYWDGGYAANPPLYPLLYDTRAADVLVVMLQPLVRAQLPRSAEQIRTRVAELQFNANFLREMRGLMLAQRAARRFPDRYLSFGWLERRLRALRFHLIEADDLVRELDTAKAMNTSTPFLDRLKREGRTRADAWLTQHWGALGRRTSVDLEALFG